MRAVIDFQQGTVLLNLMFVLLFFNLSFIAIMGYSHSLQMSFQQLINMQQVTQATFVVFEQASLQSPFYFVYDQIIMTQSSLAVDECQKIEGDITNKMMSAVRLYYWSCYK